MSEPVRGCGLRALYRVEGYSDSDTSLDWAFYACDAHREEARTEWMPGLNTYVSPTPPGKRCGESFDYTTHTQSAGPDPVPGAVDPDTDAPTPYAIEKAYRMVETAAVAIGDPRRARWTPARSRVARMTMRDLHRQVGEWLADNPGTGEG